MPDGHAVPVEVMPAGPERLDALAPVFGRAFVDDPMMGWTMGDLPRTPDRYTPCFSAFLQQVLPCGVVWEAGAVRAAGAEAGRALGAAAWIPPGQFEEWAVHPWNQPRILECTDDGGRRYEAFWQWIDEHGPAEPAWLLDSIAVDPVVQGRGYGSELIADGLERARSEGLGAHLSTGTERNVAVYSRLGFRVAEALDAPDHGPHIWFMCWDP